MNTSFEDQIRERAYQLWLSGVEGHAHDHWIWAEQAVIGEHTAAQVEPVVIITKAKPRKAAAKPSAGKAAARTGKVAKASAAEKAAH